MRNVLTWLACVLVSVPCSASAQTGLTSTLSWTRLPGAEACPTVVDVGREVEALLGRSVLVGASDADRIVEVAVAPGTEGVAFVASIVVAARDGTVLGRRDIPSSDAACADLGAHAALAIALMIDPDARLAPDETEPEAEPEPEPEVVVREVLVREPLGPPTRLTVDLGAAATLGVGPFVSGAGVLRVLLTLDGFVPFGIVGVLQPFSRGESAAGSVDFTTVLAGLTICPLYFHGPSASAGACAGVDLGGALAASSTLPEPLRERERLLVQLDVSAYGRLVVYGPIAVQLLAALFVPFRNDPWVTTGGATFSVPEPVAGMLQLGISIDVTLAGDPQREQHLP